jgi:hypothetical protein
MATAQRAAELEVLFTANLDDVGRAEKVIKTAGDRIEKKPIKAKVDADTTDAVAGMDRVETQAKKLVSERAIVKLDADISRAEKGLARAVDRLEDLQIRAEGGLDVTADVKRAENQIKRMERYLDGLTSARQMVTVDADTAPMEQAAEQGGKSFFRKLDGATRGAGEKVGATVGAGVEESLISALTAIPIAGGIVLAGVAIGKAVAGGIQDGLSVEARQDRLQALAGLDVESARRIGLAAGEAYANVFGESIESNMDTARLGLQFGLIDEDATSRDAQKVIQSLAGIADALDEDVRPVASAVATMLQSGLAKSAEEAYDVLATGAREGVNRAEDLLDTFTEYPALFKRLGLSGPEALGLISQGLRAGARNGDLAADALKEFQIRATDASEASAEGFYALGLDAEEMTAKIARGGQDARDGLDEVLRKLRETEDPVARNAAAVALFGTQAEDLGEALFAMDLSTAVDQLDGVTGAAQRMFDTLADNDATKLDQARRNIEVGVQGIQGALAAAFSEPLGDAADWVSRNRGPMLQFFLDLANGALDFAETASDGFGAFVSGPLAEMLEGLIEIIDWTNGFEGKPPELVELARTMRKFDETTDDASDAISEARERLNEFGEGAVALAYVNDAAQRTAESVANLGSEHGTLNSQVRDAVAALEDELRAAQEAGESQDNLTERYNTTTDALVNQLMQMGYTQEGARQLIEQYGAVPTMVNTIITGDTGPARATVDEFVRTYNGKEVRLRLTTNQVVVGDRVYGGLRGDPSIDNARGNVIEFYRNGGIPGLTPMQPIAQMVPANTWRVVGDRGDVPELYAPLDGSARSWALLMEGFRRMPGAPASAGQSATSSQRAPESQAPATPQVIQLVLPNGRVLFEALREYSRSVR